MLSSDSSVRERNVQSLYEVRVEAVVRVQIKFQGVVGSFIRAVARLFQPIRRAGDGERAVFGVERGVVRALLPYQVDRKGGEGWQVPGWNHAR